MELVAIVSMLALVECTFFGFRVGGMRGKYDVAAPATTGNEIFERYYRVHYNTLEQLIIFLPSLWVFGYYIGQYWAAGIGSIFLVGRILYYITYIKDPDSRGPGMALSFISSWILLLGALIGSVTSFVSSISQ
jgi:glutathione S-transferase